MYRITSPLPQAVACLLSRSRGCIHALPVRHFRHQCFKFCSRLWPCCFLHFRNFLPHRFPLKYYTIILTPINLPPPPRFLYLAPLPFLNSRKLIISLTHPRNPLHRSKIHHRNGRLMWHLPVLITAHKFRGVGRKRVVLWSGAAGEEFDCVCILGRRWRGGYFVG
jgi:hypothetical protein